MCVWRGGGGSCLCPVRFADRFYRLSCLYYQRVLSGANLLIYPFMINNYNEFHFREKTAKISHEFTEMENRPENSC